MPVSKIYLKDCVDVLLKHKWVVILIPVISVSITAFMLFGWTKEELPLKKYEAVVVIQNGFFGGEIIRKSDGFEKVKMLAEQLECNVEVNDIGGTNYFKISIIGPDKDSIKDECERLATDYINYGNSIYNESYLIYEERLENMEERKRILQSAIGMMNSERKKYFSILELQKQAIDGEISRLEKIADELRKTTGDKEGGISVAVLECENIISRYQIWKLEVEENMSNAAIADIKLFSYKLSLISETNKILDSELWLAKTKRFEIIKPVKVIEIPAGKLGLNKKNKLLLSLLCGLMGGIILAFAMENWNIAKGDGK